MNLWKEFWEDVGEAFSKATKRAIQEPLALMNQARLQAEVDTNAQIIRHIDLHKLKLREYRRFAKKRMDKAQQALEELLLAESRAAMATTTAKYASLKTKVGDVKPVAVDKVETKDGAHDHTHKKGK